MTTSVSWVRRTIEEGSLPANRFPCRARLVSTCQLVPVHGNQTKKSGTEYDWVKVPQYCPTLLNKVPNKGTQGVRERYDAELPPLISIVRHPSRRVILGMKEMAEMEYFPECALLRFFALFCDFLRPSAPGMTAFGKFRVFPGKAGRIHANKKKGQESTFHESRGGCEFSLTLQRNIPNSGKYLAILFRLPGRVPSQEEAVHIQRHMDAWKFMSCPPLPCFEVSALTTWGSTICPPHFRIVVSEDWKAVIWERHTGQICVIWAFAFLSPKCWLLVTFAVRFLKMLVINLFSLVTPSKKIPENWVFCVWSGVLLCRWLQVRKCQNANLRNFLLGGGGSKRWTSI